MRRGTMDVKVASNLSTYQVFWRCLHCNSNKRVLKDIYLEHISRYQAICNRHYNFQTGNAEASNIAITHSPPTVRFERNSLRIYIHNNNTLNFTKGSYTEVKKKCTLLGGEAANTLICLCQLVRDFKEYKLLKDNIEFQNNNDNNNNGYDLNSNLGEYKDVFIRFNSVPISDDQIGQRTLSLLSHRLGNESDYRGYLELRIPNLVSSELLSSPACDIFLTSDSERTMFGFGFESMNQYVGTVKDQLLELIHWSPDSWLTFDYNTSMISDHIIDRAIHTGVNLYVMDHVLPHEIQSMSTMRSAFFYQTSTDYLGKKGSIEITLGTLRELLTKYPKMFIIITDGANGLAAGGHFHTGLSTEPVYVQPFWRLAPKMIEPVVDSVGAGDSFRSGMLFSLLQGYSLTTCLDFACVAGALNTRYIGGNTRVPQRTEILDYIAQITQR
ncbi:carbohydrate/purine kinase domain-containing protein [Heterostelium album PN500]|uniref:Carbohydrate/purine kinase domain-containing protein n=1 Tax=Heterostelium pallidum (strain ATCC 26659 / Pp 5 / PN500) TaxID=670386 RepID=D3BAF4_HETP5|nr:carbohydrate/purine kinase domain-containing protein [Heterostelium album PN500]EFA81541.1 carbohydrate/purine kinase domain-containing protein [Heterostelium album PN500]|eukprot:XP_020433658.1 carbohydrate/purine kinase domain-containing protein [Heterostelium album PN500]